MAEQLADNTSICLSSKKQGMPSSSLCKALLEATGITNQIEISNFDFESLIKVKKGEPDILRLILETKDSKSKCNIVVWEGPKGITDGFVALESPWSGQPRLIHPSFNKYSPKSIDDKSHFNFNQPHKQSPFKAFLSSAMASCNLGLGWKKATDDDHGKFLTNPVGKIISKFEIAPVTNKKGTWSSPAYLYVMEMKDGTKCRFKLPEYFAEKQVGKPQLDIGDWIIADGKCKSPHIDKDDGLVYKNMAGIHGKTFPQFHLIPTDKAIWDSIDEYFGFNLFTDGVFEDQKITFPLGILKDTIPTKKIKTADLGIEMFKPESKVFVKPLEEIKNTLGPINKGPNLIHWEPLMSKFVGKVATISAKYIEVGDKVPDAYYISEDDSEWVWDKEWLIQLPTIGQNVKIKENLDDLQDWSGAGYIISSEEVAGTEATVIGIHHNGSIEVQTDNGKLYLSPNWIEYEGSYKKPTPKKLKFTVGEKVVGISAIEANQKSFTGLNIPYSKFLSDFANQDLTVTAVSPKELVVVNKKGSKTILPEEFFIKSTAKPTPAPVPKPTKPKVPKVNLDFQPVFENQKHPYWHPIEIVKAKEIMT